MSQNLLSLKNPFKSAESFVKKIKEEVYGKNVTNPASCSTNQPSQMPPASHPSQNPDRQKSQAFQQHNYSQSECSTIYRAEHKNFHESGESPLEVKKELTLIRSTKTKRRENIEVTEYTFSNNRPSAQLDFDMDKHLTEFLKDGTNLDMIIDMVCENKPQPKVSHTGIPNVQVTLIETVQNPNFEEQQPLDFDALREQQFQQQVLVSLHVLPQLPGTQNIITQQETPAIDIRPFPPQIFLDLKFDWQMQINKTSFQGVSRSFLTCGETVRTKRYILFE